MTALNPQTPTESVGRLNRSKHVLVAYIALTKPRIIELLLLTTVPVMFLAAHGVPSLWLVTATLIGGSLSAGSANALNCVVDADIDVKMRRTARRPLPRHQVDTRNALIFGLVLGVLSTLWLGFFVNWGLAALLVIIMIPGAISLAVLAKHPESTGGRSMWMVRSELTKL
mgnify:CR=1 FL=1